jgi:hypothetical protein
MASQRSFYWKVFVSYAVVITFVVIAVSGSVLYVAPPGRVANWVTWTLGALERGQWQSVHTIFAFLFVVVGLVHLVFNWPVILAYLRMHVRTGTPRRRELAAAGLLAVGVLAATVAGTPPFSNVMAFGESVKNDWVAAEAEPPVPHAETLTIAKLSAVVGVPADRILENFARAGFSATPDATLDAVALALGSSPSAAYAIAVQGTPRPRLRIAEGGGYGQNTVEELSRRLGVPAQEVLDRLEKRGIRAKPGDLVKDVAAAHAMAPIALATLAAGE